MSLLIAGCVFICLHDDNGQNHGQIIRKSRAILQTRESGFLASTNSATDSPQLTLARATSPSPLRHCVLYF